MTTEQIVTDIMVSQYPHLERILAEEMFNKLSNDSLKKAQAIIGLPNQLGVAVGVKDAINKYRGKNNIKLECLVVPTMFIGCNTSKGSSKKVIELFGVVEIHGACFLKSRQAVFTGYKFDNPKKHPNDAPWKRTASARKSFELLDVIDNRSKVEEWLSAYRYKRCQSVILPVPRKQYTDFVKDFEC